MFQMKLKVALRIELRLPLGMEAKQIRRRNSTRDHMRNLVPVTILTLDFVSLFFTSTYLCEFLKFQPRVTARRCQDDEVNLLNYFNKFGSKHC